MTKIDLPFDLDSIPRRTRRWVRGGMKRTDRWGRKLGGRVGPLIPNTLATGGADDWTPQGLGYDPEGKTLAQSYYSHDKGSALVLVDLKGGKTAAEVLLVGRGGKAGPGHAGGVAIDGDDVWVSKGGKNSRLFRYSLAAIRESEKGAEVEPVETPAKVAAGSYCRVRGNRIYVGGFADQKLYAYEKNDDGTWNFDEPVVSTTTPPKVQGVVVRENEYVFSSSFGRHRPSKIYICKRKRDGGVGAVQRTYKFPNMAEAIVEVAGDLITTYESGASSYSRPAAYGFGILIGRMWASTHMTCTPIAALGLAPDPEAG
ncbi:hypothetical protein J2S40_004066 [Nocardioides luteus]|uniref:Uncharacterized protein n=1 Tax=Nocardioides luteus TaxID=1844 RepID=A0ABQ5SR87_9ACTN|nr:hypothetical protein [Nocardioides luteus]MDR7313008.1 hypothetical protein [Nocardioides luteus]GGR44715.1 hypothetical protein GCM10010197_07930 [Nocardioides luteus]GLJ66068.1 hypothetical protein GCM10017579_01040 [Nocardioides luteus]